MHFPVKSPMVQLSPFHSGLDAWNNSNFTIWEIEKTLYRYEQILYWKVWLKVKMEFFRWSRPTVHLSNLETVPKKGTVERKVYKTLIFTKIWRTFYKINFLPKKWQTPVSYSITHYFRFYYFYVIPSFDKQFSTVSVISVVSVVSKNSVNYFRCN